MTGIPISSSWTHIPVSPHGSSRSPEPIERHRRLGNSATQRGRRSYADDLRRRIALSRPRHRLGCPLPSTERPRLVKLPACPWQSKRFWNETQEGAEDLHYNPVHPLFGQPDIAVHPTWKPNSAPGPYPSSRTTRYREALSCPVPRTSRWRSRPRKPPTGEPITASTTWCFDGRSSSTRPAIPFSEPLSTAKSDPPNRGIHASYDRGDVKSTGTFRRSRNSTRWRGRLPRQPAW